jgi:site-specific recombinase XerD
MVGSTFVLTALDHPRAHTTSTIVSPLSSALAGIDLHWHDLRHEALSRLADDGVPVHELQLLAGHASITTTQRYMNARASSLAESMRQARTRRVTRLEHSDEASVQIG